MTNPFKIKKPKPNPIPTNWPFPQIDAHGNPIIVKPIKEKVDKNRTYNSVKDSTALL